MATRDPDAKDLSFVGKLLRYIRDPKVATWKKLSGIAAAVYVASPIDIVPDVIPILGWMDDLGILGAFAAFMFREVRKHSRELEQPRVIDLNEPPKKP